MVQGQRLKTLEKHPQFAEAYKIAQNLNEQGYLTVFAGGCVRDSLLGLIPKDLDLATAAPPEIVERSFLRTLAVGKSFGTIVVISNGHHFEVTTFRADGPYLNGRHPSNVSFSNIEEDARRRDFTVNALFYNPLTREILDFVNGRADLEKKILRTVGDARQRFEEDHLRMLRAVRFVAQLGFDLDDLARHAIIEGRQELIKVSAERVFTEIRKLLESPFVMNGLKELLHTHLYEVCWSELAAFDPEKLRAFSLPARWEMVFAGICWLQGVRQPVSRLQAWKAPRESLKLIESLLQELELFANGASKRCERVRALGSGHYLELINLLHGILGEDQIEPWLNEYLTVASQEGTLPRPYLSGTDLKDRGIPPGPQMGRLLDEIYDAQLEGRIRSREEAIEWLARTNK